MLLIKSVLVYYKTFALYKNACQIKGFNNVYCLKKLALVHENIITVCTYLHQTFRFSNHSYVAFQNVEK